MSDNLWGEEEPFSDVPEEAQTGPNGKPVAATHQYAPPVIPPGTTQRPQRKLPELEPEEVAEFEAEEAELYDIEEDFSDVLSDAHLRLEQGSLYKMIMNHDLFSGVDADPKAIRNVQKQIAQFAREQMEVMLGMRQEAAEVTQVVSPFNDLEVEVLKRLASKATNGATETEEANQVATSFKQAPKKNTINPIGNLAPRKAPAPVTKPKAKPLPAKAPTPVKRTRQELLIEQIAREEGVSVADLELDVKGIGGKPVRQLTIAELEERNRLAAQRRGTQVKSASAVPMATFEEQVAKAQAQFNSIGSGQMADLNKRIIESVKAMGPSLLLNKGEE
jgi:hypothetical protein